MKSPSAVFQSLFWVVAASGLLWCPASSGQDPFPEGVEGEIYYCPRIDRVPGDQGGPLEVELDGELDEEVWKRAAFHGWNEYWKGGALPTNLDDCDPKWAVVADEDFLYVAWRIADEQRQSQSTGCGIFNDDAIEIYFDGKGDGITCGDCPYGLDDMQLLVGTEQIGKTDPNLLEVGWVRSGGCVASGTIIDTTTGENIMKGVVADLKSENNTPGWQGEIAIALRTMTNGEWNVEPRHGTTIGWDIHIDDDDAGGGQDAGTSALIWSKRDPNSQAWRNPGVWGKLQFVVPGKPLVEVSRDIPDDLVNGGSGAVSLTAKPIFGVGTVVIEERLPAGLTPSNPSLGGVVAGNAVTWNLGAVNTDLEVTYTLTVDPGAVDSDLPGRATIDGEPISITGDTAYTGSPVSKLGFIKLWNHLGPLAYSFPAVTGDHGPPGACDANFGAELGLDWIVNEDASITEADIHPFPGMLTRVKYGGNGVIPGTGARAAGLTVAAGDTGLVVRDRFPVWKSGQSPLDIVDHGSAAVHGFDADDHVTLSCIYVTNNTGAAIDTQVGVGSDDSIQVYVGSQSVGEVPVCRGWGPADQELDLFPAVLPVGESRVLVKVTDGVSLSGFRLRFRDPAGTGGLLPPDISLSLESSRIPPPGKVDRKFAGETFRTGEAVAVSLEAAARTRSEVMITELLPAGSSAQNLSDGGVLKADRVEWSLAGVEMKTVTYDLVPFLCASAASYGQSTFAIDEVEALIGGAGSVRREFAADASLGQWTGLDIASSGGGTELLGGRSFLIRGQGAQIGRTQDEFQFVFVERTGDWEIRARLDCLEDVNPLASAGLMARSTIDPYSAFIYLYGTPAAGVRASKRIVTSTTRTSQSVIFGGGASLAPPIWLRLKRTAGNLELSQSPDGASFTKLTDVGIGPASSTNVDLPDRVLVGMAVTSTDPGRAGLAAFSGVSVLPEACSPPSGLTAVLEGGGVKISWTAPAAGAPVAGYNVYQARPGARAKLNAAPVAETQFTAPPGGAAGERCYVVASVCEDGSESPDSEEVCFTPPVSGFKRGDTDANGSIEITDPISLLGFLFLGDAQPPCFDAADTDDNGALEITDAIASLGFQFLGEAAPPPPGPTSCGPDPTPDPPGEDFGCEYPSESC